MGFSKCLYLKKTAAPVFGEKGPHKRLDVSALRAERRKQLEEKGEKETDSDENDTQPEVEIETAEDYESVRETYLPKALQSSTDSSNLMQSVQSPAYSTVSNVFSSTEGGGCYTEAASLENQSSGNDALLWHGASPQGSAQAVGSLHTSTTGRVSTSLLPGNTINNIPGTKDFHIVSSEAGNPVRIISKYIPATQRSMLAQNSTQSLRGAMGPALLLSQSNTEQVIYVKKLPQTRSDASHFQSATETGVTSGSLLPATSSSTNLHPVALMRNESQPSVSSSGLIRSNSCQSAAKHPTIVTVSKALLTDKRFPWQMHQVNNTNSLGNHSHKIRPVTVYHKFVSRSDIIGVSNCPTSQNSYSTGTSVVSSALLHKTSGDVKVVRKSPYVRLTHLDKTGSSDSVSSDSVSDLSGTWLKDPQDKSVYRLTHGQSMQSLVRERPSIQPMSTFVTSNQDTPASTSAIHSAFMHPVTSRMISDQNIPVSTPEIHSAHIDPVLTATSVVSNLNTTASTSVLQSCHIADVKREPDIPEDATTSLTFSPANSIKQELLCEAINTSEVDSGANCSKDADGKEMDIKVETVDEDMSGRESRDKRHEVTNGMNGNREDTFVSVEQIFSMGKAGKEQEGSKDSSVVTLSELGEGGVTREEIQMEADDSESTGEANTCNKSEGEVSYRVWNSKDNEVSESEATGDVAMTDDGNDVHTEDAQNLNRDKGKGVSNLQSSSGMSSENNGGEKDNEADDCEMDMTVEEVDTEEATPVNTEASRRITPSQTTPATRTVELTHEMLSDEKLFFSIIRWSCKIVAAMGGNIRLRVLLPQMSSTKYDYTLNVTKDLLECRETLERELEKIRVFLLIKKKEAIVNLKFVDD